MFKTLLCLLMWNMLFGALIGESGWFGFLMEYWSEYER